MCASWARRASIVAAAWLAWGCNNTPVKVAWEEALKPILPPGYQSFAVEVNGYDNGVRIFSFAPAAASKGQRVLQELKDRISQQYPCYELIASNEHLVRMECPTPADRYSRIRRVEFVLDSSGHRVFGMTISNDHSPDLQQDYEETLLSLAHRGAAAR